jgi:hypothetical protein
MAKMYGRGPNNCEHLEPLNERDPKYLNTAPAGDIKQAGYKRVERRPRVNGVDEIMPSANADMIEGYYEDPFGY